MSNKSKINYIDLFAGCGGLSDGFEQTGNFRLAAAVEWDYASYRTLVQRLCNRWGYSDAEDRVIRFDIQRAEELINGWSNDPEYESGPGLKKVISKRDKVDVVIGGPPCQAYSVAGRIRDNYSMHYDYRNYLFENYLDIVSYFKPSIVVFENVPGILSAKPGGASIIERVQKAFKTAGFEIIDDIKNSAVFNFEDYGVPQRRKRVIILGLSRKDFGYEAQSLLKKFYNEIMPRFRYNGKKRSVFDTIGCMPTFKPRDSLETFNGRRFSHSLNSIPLINHVPRYHNQRDIKIFKILTRDASSQNKKYKTADDLKKLYTKKTGKKSNVHKYHVLRWNELSNTIPAHLYKDGLRHIHPDFRQARSITVREAARIQTFDDDFEFLGSMGDQFKMVGNAVPPLFSKALGRGIKSLLLELK